MKNQLDSLSNQKSIRQLEISFIEYFNPDLGGIFRGSFWGV